MTSLATFPDLWAQLPPDVRALLPARLQAVLPAALFLATIAARLIKQRTSTNGR